LRRATLRELLQEAGLRDLEREATFAIERGKTWHLINLFSYWEAEHPDDTTFQERWGDWKLEGHVGFDLGGLSKTLLDDPQVIISALNHKAEVGKGLLRLVAFDWTTAYGLHPVRALLFIFWIGVLLIPAYAWAIFRIPHWCDSPGIYRIWSKERIEANAGRIQLSDANDVERVTERNWRAITWATYFSLLSAFHIGFRDINVGNWIARVQAHEYTLKPTGWVRVVSGLQSLLSIYLLTIWALTYFSRPFQ
jgi:hypothetical protein